ncbi:hypothetical protein MAPG_01728 [Magnaporthiopsis poae ATCC 64411]|uniref:Uncharacterized protein n=1 Tax=Magnaporthiopsis poae (strain ATCC 64411 / 73-15) TaxID=644358 RepID=A0A0C4DPG3_MAGP6|nr:hypothetical protein MAPG_01728 [Magnaporthiopsis poae ATCC 64411]
MPRHWRLPGMARSRLPSRQQAPQQALKEDANASPRPRVVPPPGARTEFEKPVTSGWDVPVPLGPALGRLLSGFQPESMHDKWMVWAEDNEASSPNTAGDDRKDPVSVSVLHFVRSRTGYPFAQVTLVTKNVGEEARFTEITWESSEKRVSNQTEESTKNTVLQVCVHVLGVEWQDASSV